MAKVPASTLVPGESVRVVPEVTVTFPESVTFPDHVVLTETVLSAPETIGNSKTVSKRVAMLAAFMRPMHRRYGVAISTQRTVDNVDTHGNRWWARPDLNRGLTAPSRQV